jgi:uncharacterized repeat protein (TIGR01451 family)
MNVPCAIDRRSKPRRRARQSFRGLLEPLEPRLAPATFVVNSTADQPAVDPSNGAETASGSITLRSAIEAANAHSNDAAGPDRIEFNILGSGVRTIVPFSEFPAITDPVVVDGYSQPGARANTLDTGSDAVLLIELDNVFGFTNGVTINAGSSTVRGLVIDHFSDAITLADHGGNVVAGNYIGTDPSGQGSLSNTIGVYVAAGADGNTIGGTDPSDRNVIAGNVMGLRIVASSNNVVQGNYFGVAPSGMVALGGNGQGNIVVTSGVAGEVTGPATGNLIGGTAPGARNVISSGGAGIIFGGDQASLTSGNLVQGNYIGTDANGAGNGTFSNNGPGVLLDSGKGTDPGAKANTIGGDTAAARNVISGNNSGVLVAAGAKDNVVRGNFIGTDATGGLAMPNSAGIDVRGDNTTIVGNLVSGSRNDAGIVFRGASVGLVQGNLIGTDATGTRAISNVYGIVLDHSNFVVIGGTTAAERNVVSGNGFSAIYLLGSGIGNQIRGNFIGTDISGTQRLTNNGDGILIDFNDPAGDNRDTLIGGIDPGAGNTIAFNGANGIEVRNSTAVAKEADGEIDSNTIFSNSRDGILLARGNVADPRYSITRNSIFSNSSLGIDLGDDGVTANDSEGHVGPNNFQNFPTITAVAASATATQVSGTLKSAPNLVHRIEFFANEEGDPSGHGEGQTFLGFTIVSTDNAGNASFDKVALPPLPAGQTFVTATATDGDGRTSEFSGASQPGPVQAVADLSIAVTAAPDPVPLGASLTYTITVTNHGPGAADNVKFTTAVPAQSTFVSFAAPPGWTATNPAPGGTGDVSARIARLESGATAVFSLVVRVADFVPSTDALTAIGYVTSDTGDPDTSNNTAAASASVPRQADRTDLAIAVSAAPKSVRPGQALTFTITATNNGPIAAGDDAITVNLPAQTTFRSVAAPDGWQTQLLSDGGTDELLASFATLEAGATAVLTVTVVVQPTAAVGSTLTGVARIVSETLDPNPANDTAQDSAVVAQAPAPDPADLAIAVSASPKPVLRGQVLTFTIAVANNGPVAADNVVMALNTPGGTTFRSVAAPGGWKTSAPPVGAAGTITETIASLGVGASAVFTITVDVDPAAAIGSTVTGVATVASGTPDADPANNSARDSAVVAQAPAASLVVAIVGNANPATVGQDVTYTIAVVNPSGAAATGVVVHVAIPGTATLVSPGGGSPTPSGVDLGVGTLAAGGSRLFQIAVRPESAGAITLVADPGAAFGGPGSVTTAVVGTPPAPPPTVLSAVRYGFHDQPTILVVTFSKEVSLDEASDPRNYEVLVSARGPGRAVPISRVSYDPQAHQATLLVSQKIYVFRPWQLVVRGHITDTSGQALAGDGVAGHDFVAPMSLRSLAGPASAAPGAARIGVNAVPAGPRASQAKRVAHAGDARPARSKTGARTSPKAKALSAASARVAR